MTHGAKGALDLHSGIKLDFFRKRPKVQKDSGGVKKGKMFWNKIKSFFLPEMPCVEFDCVLWVCWNLTLQPPIYWCFTNMGAHVFKIIKCGFKI